MYFNEKLKEVINSNESIKRYRILEDHINNDPKLLDKLDELKSLQKQIVHAKELDKNEMLKKLELDYKKLFVEIENYPLMLEYLHLQKEINLMLQEFKNVIETGINNDLMGY